MATTTRTYGGVTAEQRRSRRRAALLDAALDVLAADGTEAVTVRGVCARARLNDRYFYESFADRDELLVEVLDDVAAEGVQSVLRSIEGLPEDTDVLVRAAVEAAVGFLVADSRRGRVLVQSQSTELMRQRRQNVVRLLAGIMVERSRDLLGDLAPSELDSELAALTLVSGALELTASWLRGEVDVSREHFTDFLVAMVLTTTDISKALKRAQ